MIDNTGKSAIVTGVRDKRSIAWKAAKALKESGCSVLFTAAPSELGRVKKLVEFEYPDSEVVPVDVTNESTVKILASTAKKLFPQGIDYLLHAIAFGNHNVLCTKDPSSNEPACDYLNIPWNDLSKSIQISAYSLISMCKILDDQFKDNETSIVSYTYQASERVYSFYAGMSISKAALENIVKYLAFHYGPRKIRVNCISPSGIRTTSASGIKGMGKFLKEADKHLPLGKISADDVARATLFYFSDLSKGQTGNLHYVDGGEHIMGAINGE